MRRKRRLGLAAAMVLLVVSVLTGCGGEKKETAEEILEQVRANTEDMDSLSAGMTMELSMNVAESGVSMTLDMDGDFDMEFTSDPMASHMKGTLSMSLMGISMEMESYTVVEDDKNVTYTNSAGEWTRTESEMTDENQTEAMVSLFDDAVSYTLSDETEEVDGEEAYVLTAEVSGNLMQDLMGGMAESMDEVSGTMDWSAFSADVTLKVNRETKMPAQVVMDCGDSLSALLESSSEDSASVGIDKYVITITFHEFDNVEEIVVPEEAKSAVEGNSDTDGNFDDFLNETESEGAETQESETDETAEEGPVANADGTYTLNSYWGEGSVNIGVPQGFEVSPYSDDTYLAFVDTYNKDLDSVYLSYNLSSDYTEEELLDYYQDDVAYYQEDEDYSNVTVEDAKKVQTSRGEAGYVKVSYTFDGDSNYVEYYAYMFLDDNLVLECNIEENAYQQECSLVDEATIMETVFSVVS